VKVDDHWLQGKGPYPDGNQISDEQTPHKQEPELGAKDPWREKYLHLLADLENIRKRLTRTSAREVDEHTKALLKDVLPVADGLDLALLHLSRDVDSRNILQGIEMIKNLLDKFFAKHDVTVIEAWGQQFDPNLHQAVGLANAPDVPPNTVVKVQQKGYLYHDELLRPAQVLVSPRQAGGGN
jgi:molecular chaperone GrpE